MLEYALDAPQYEYRNFNVCPHCKWRGQDAILSRLSEGIPMISRSDGRTFHLLLADRPLPYPVERSSGKSTKLSLCFWYSFGGEGSWTKSSLVLLLGTLEKSRNIFRDIEFVADLLSSELLRKQHLGGLYELRGQALRELTY